MFYGIGSYYSGMRVLDFGSTAWNETQGGAHNITVGSETSPANNASYGIQSGIWMRSTHSGGGKQFVLGSHYATKYGFDIGTSGTTISNITTHSFSMGSNAHPQAWTYNGTAGEVFCLASGTSLQSYLFPVTIDSSNNLSEGTSVSGPASGTQSSQNSFGMEYVGTQDSVIALVYGGGGQPSIGTLPGEDGYIQQKKNVARMFYSNSFVYWCSFKRRLVRMEIWHIRSCIYRYTYD